MTISNYHSPTSDIVGKQYTEWMYPESIVDLPTWLQSNCRWFDLSHLSRLFWPNQEPRDMDSAAEIKVFCMHGGAKLVRKALTKEQIDLVSRLPEWSWNRQKIVGWITLTQSSTIRKSMRGKWPPMTDKNLEWNGLRIIGWMSKQR
jgi:hypothetical protein